MPSTCCRSIILVGPDDSRLQGGRGPLAACRRRRCTLLWFVAAHALIAAPAPAALVSMFAASARVAVPITRSRCARVGVCSAGVPAARPDARAEAGVVCAEGAPAGVGVPDRPILLGQQGRCRCVASSSRCAALLHHVAQRPTHASHCCAASCPAGALAGAGASALPYVMRWPGFSSPAGIAALVAAASVSALFMPDYEEVEASSTVAGFLR